MSSTAIAGQGADMLVAGDSPSAVGMDARNVGSNSARAFSVAVPNPAQVATRDKAAKTAARDALAPGRCAVSTTSSIERCVGCGSGFPETRLRSHCFTRRLMPRHPRKRWRALCRAVHWRPSTRVRFATTLAQLHQRAGRVGRTLRVPEHREARAGHDIGRIITGSALGERVRQLAQQVHASEHVLDQHLGDLLAGPDRIQRREGSKHHPVDGVEGIEAGSAFSEVSACAGCWGAASPGSFPRRVMGGMPAAPLASASGLPAWW